jgi:predicted Zn-dependent peptidase
MKLQKHSMIRLVQKTLLFISLPALLLSTLAPFGAARAQSAPEPRREQLLNGLKIFLLHRPGDAQVFVRLRIHSGAAFDLAGKEGLMALLGDALFPDPATRQYVTEELGGRLEVTTDYDRIDVTLTGRAQEFERIVELLRSALVNTQLLPEVVGRLREARLKAVRDVSIAPSTVADRAISKRLFGEHPYGRIVEGSTESLARVERPDLILVRERFLNPNNASLVAIGGVEPSRATRALRQFLGVWRRSDAEVPSTFRLPEPPDARPLIVDFAGMPDAEVRLAVRGLARKDRDAAAARLLAIVARERWLKSFPELKGRAFFAEHHAYSLPGVFRMGASVPSNLAAQALQTGRAALQSLSTTQASAEELEVARREVLATLGKNSETPEALSDLWLNQVSYGLNASDEMRLIGALTPSDVQRVAAKILRSATIASVAIGDATQLRAELARAGEVEVLGASLPAPTPTQTPTAKPSATPAPITIPVRRP